MDRQDFYQQCAIAAMQGIQECGKFSIIADTLPDRLSKLAFDIADAMLKELDRRTVETK